MGDDSFDMSVRKFLKQLGVTAHQEMSRALAGCEQGRTFKARAVVTLEGTELEHIIEADIVPPADGA